ncbi:MAG: glycosyltransferase family 2 protein [Candidatus Magasanikbacteria bacterium]|nr:glycosyltransferase family 2 protein [Candidatus Magasanikbacteria bacterium]
MLTDYQRYRFYEMLPGLSIWGTIIGVVVLSLARPLWMLYAILVFDVYWVLRVLYFSIYLVISWRRFRRAVATRWLPKLAAEFPGRWETKINVIFLPLYNEEWAVVEATLEALRHSSYPASRLYVVVSGEARQADHWRQIQEQLKTRYTGRFADLICYTHPADLPGEIPGKGSNINWAEHQFKQYADARHWQYRDIIISVFDIDTVVHPEYFAHLTYLYCRHPRPERSSFQPLTLYHNNLWESPAVLRLMAFGTTFWMLFSLARLDHLVTFSSHSMSFQAALDSGGHAKDIVSEDSRIFYQCWLHYAGDYEVTPLYVPVSMDTVRERRWWMSLKNLYYQQRRWAWGSENIPYLLWGFRRHPEISWRKKIGLLLPEWEGKWSWAVVAILITLLGRLPLWLAGDELRTSALFFNTPHMLENLMRLAMVGLFISAILSLLLLPRRPESHPPHRYLYMILQWLLLPFSLLFFSALPCLDAVTHLMFGRYLGFNVSAKKRSEP